jgi:hypothetical protein
MLAMPAGATNDALVFEALWRALERLHAKNIPHNLLISHRAERV